MAKFGCRNETLSFAIKRLECFHEIGKGSDIGFTIYSLVNG
jgi:hypothetical protein